MDLNRYLRDVTPYSILQVLDERVLASLLNGYSFALGAGITVLFPRSESFAIVDLDRKDALGAESAKSFNPLCRCWRDARRCGRQQVCIDADRDRAQNYFQGSLANLCVYRCRPLGLFDMTYPLRIDGKVIGVLFGGQIIVRGGRVDWKESLNKFEDCVDWRTTPSVDDHVEFIRDMVLAAGLEPKRQAEMLDILDHPQEKDLANTDVSDLKRRIEDFRRFGEMTQGLINELHKAKKTAAEQELLRQCTEGLASLDLEAKRAWKEKCGVLLSELRELPEIRDVHLYSRQGSRYIQWFPYLTQEADQQTPVQPGRLHVRDVVLSLPLARLAKLSGDNCTNLIDAISLGPGDLWAFRSERGLGREVLSSLVVLQGAVRESRHDFLADLCAVICLATDSASVRFRERDADEEYKLRVSLIAHSFRTPLQALQFDFEDLAKHEALVGHADAQTAAREGLVRIGDAREDLRELLDTAEQTEQDFDLIPVLKHVIAGLEPIAKRHPCKITRIDPWPEKACVHGNRYLIQRALTCLLDNAIKYSFYGPHRDGRLYEATVSVRLESGYVETEFTNYGIGIPPDKLNIIRDYGTRYRQRLKVVDQKRARGGTGLGFRFAYDIFEEFGGWIYPSSRPAGSATPDEIANFRRYITTVEAALPLAHGGVQE